MYAKSAAYALVYQVYQYMIKHWDMELHLKRPFYNCIWLSYNAHCKFCLKGFLRYILSLSLWILVNMLTLSCSHSILFIW